MRILLGYNIPTWEDNDMEWNFNEFRGIVINKKPYECEPVLPQRNFGFWFLIGWPFTIKGGYNK